MAEKYTQAEIDEMGKKGEAFGPDDDGHYSYPIGDEEDLDNAIHAVGRGNADHDAIRKYIIGRAKDLSLSSKIPDNWNSDGSLSDAKAAPGTLEWRRKRAEEMAGSTNRSWSVERVELRKSADDGMLHLTGYASTTNTPYDMGWYTEQIARGAFKKTLSENPDVVLNLNHGNAGSGLPIARTKAGNLKLSEDSKGLRVEAALDPEDLDVQLLARKMDSGNLDGQMSFAFRATRQEWDEDYTDRCITECDIHRGDVSVVTQGANPTTSSSIRSWDDLVGAAVEMRSASDIPEDRRAVLEQLIATAKVEDRVGKTISKATKAKVQSAIDALAGLIGDGDDGDDDGDQQNAAPTSGPGPTPAPETASLPLPDNISRALVQLAAARAR